MNRIQMLAFVIAAGLAVVLCLCFTIASVPANGKAGTIELERRINPNDAPPASLTRLPGIGLARAQAIINYRERFQQNGQGDLAFLDCSDLDKVKGIGPATARDMCEWLRFR
jgi:DNA uptake protein ComE-like DNA-binding protein